MTTIPIVLDRVDGQGVHDDLVLTFGENRHIGDSYYLAIDESPEAGGSVSAALVRLLDQWVENLHRLQDGEREVFLPFGFFDQSTVWLRVATVDEERVGLDVVWSTIEAWTLTPSNYAAAIPPVLDVTPVDDLRIECLLGDLITTVENNRAAFRRA